MSRYNGAQLKGDEREERNRRLFREPAAGESRQEAVSRLAPELSAGKGGTFAALKHRGLHQGS
jgi:hypothetical protein